MTLYVLVIAIVMTGWAAYRPSPFSPEIRPFGFLTVPHATGAGGISSWQYAAVHRSLVWAFIGLVSFHAGAALVHAVILRDGVMSAMIFGRRAPNPQGDRPPS